MRHRIPLFIVAPLTTTRRGLSLHIDVEATAAIGLDTTIYVQCELIRSINRNRHVDHLGAVTPDIRGETTTLITTLLNH